MRRVIDPDGFEALFQAEPDPWDYAASSFELQKRKVLLAGCGLGRLADGASPCEGP